MIRRDAGHDWLLISQVEHARIAAEVASDWSHAAPAAPPLSDLLIHAIQHHDDGWAEWEQAPTIVPETGAPRDFLEMPIRDAALIWSRSIAACAQRSPWCGLWVSRHFCTLAEHARGHRESKSDRDAASSFLRVQSELQRGWRCRLAGNPDADSLRRDEETGCAWLRWFDLLSLRLCCDERPGSEVLSFPGGGCIELTPHDEHTVTLRPYLLRQPSLRIKVSAARIPRCRFASDDEFRAVLRHAAQCEFSWKLTPQ